MANRGVATGGSPGSTPAAWSDGTVDERFEGPESRLAGVRNQSITVIVLTYNEAPHIERCLSRIQPVVERVIVVDSYSTDNTVAIARRMGAEVYQHPFKHQADQFQWALDTIDIRTEWILKLDADEYFEPAAVEEIRKKLDALPAEITGIEFKRKFIFMGRWIRWGGYYPTVLTRLWRTGRGYIEQRWMDEHVVLRDGNSVRFDQGDLVDENLHGVDAWTTKHNRYATRQMVDFINREHKLFQIDDALEESGHAHARRRRFLRNRVFGQAPLYLRSVLLYVYRYIIRLGFLDGKVGFVFHTMHGLWFFLLIDAKIDEARAYIRAHGIEAFKQHLREHHGIEL